MSRSGYIDDDDDILQLGRWRGQVASAMRGKRGQAFLKEMLDAMDAMPIRRLIAGELEAADLVSCSHWGLYEADSVCAIGTLGKARGVDMSGIDPEDYSAVAAKFGIAEPMAQEIVYMNDEAFDSYWCKTPEERWQKMRAWIVGHIKPDATAMPPQDVTSTPTTTGA